MIGSQREIKRANKKKCQPKNAIKQVIIDVCLIDMGTHSRLVCFTITATATYIVGNFL